MRTDALVLHVKQKWFDLIKGGFKREEYRKVTLYWSKRIENPNLKWVSIICGYPHQPYLSNKLILFPFTGYCIKEITHEEFENKPTIVYAIKLVK